MFCWFWWTWSLHLRWWSEHLLSIKNDSTCIWFPRRKNRIRYLAYFLQFQPFNWWWKKFGIIESSSWRRETLRKNKTLLCSAMIIENNATIVGNFPPRLSFAYFGYPTHFILIINKINTDCKYFVSSNKLKFNILTIKKNSFNVFQGFSSFIDFLQLFWGIFNEIRNKLNNSLI